jgi:histidine ammonia-lyase
MGSALKLRQIVSNVEYILAIELMCAAQGVDFHRPLQPGTGSRLALQHIRRRVSRLTADRVLAIDIERIRRLVADGILGGVLSAIRATASTRRRTAS